MYMNKIMYVCIKCAKFVYYNNLKQTNLCFFAYELIKIKNFPKYFLILLQFQQYFGK